MRRGPAAAEQSLLKTFGLAALAVVVVASACNGEKSAASGPTAPAPSMGGPPVPTPSGAVSGRIDNLDTVADLVTYNQAANVGLSIPVEGAIQRTTGIITRWELPIPVYVDPSIIGNCVGEALAYWQSVTGLSYVLVGADAEPRITVRAAGSDELNIAIGSGLVYRTYPNDRARLGVVKILTSNATCSAPSALFRHELGHTLGIFGHPSGGLMSAPMVGTTASQREINLLVQLYRLPHGTRIDPDGSWRVVQP
jgi:hypothetical protein